MALKVRDGWKYGPTNVKEKKIHSCLIPYDQLGESDKQSDRDFVRGIHEILTIAGYKIIKS